MKRIGKFLAGLSLKKSERVLRDGDRRKRNRRYERVTSMKDSPDYQTRVKSDRRKGERRK